MSLWRPKAGWLDEKGRGLLAQARVALEGVDPFEEAEIERVLGELIEREGAKPRDVYQPLAVAITGTTISPGMFESLATGRSNGSTRRSRRTRRAPDAPAGDPREPATAGLLANCKLPFAPLPIGIRRKRIATGPDGR